MSKIQQEIGNDISSKIRASIKKRLTELGSYIDDELPDYVMIMLANRKTKAQMVSDLRLFLSSNTEVFVEWVHEMVSTLDSVTKGDKESKAAPVPIKERKSEVLSKESAAKKRKSEEDEKKKKDREAKEEKKRRKREKEERRKKKEEKLALKKAKAAKPTPEKEKPSTSEKSRPKVSASLASKAIASSLADSFQNKQHSRKKSTDTKKERSRSPAEKPHKSVGKSVIGKVISKKISSDEEDGSDSSSEAEVSPVKKSKLSSVASVQRKNLVRRHRPSSSLLMKAVKEAQRSTSGVTLASQRIEAAVAKAKPSGGRVKGEALSPNETKFTIIVPPDGVDFTSKNGRVQEVESAPDSPQEVAISVKTSQESAYVENNPEPGKSDGDAQISPTPSNEENGYDPKKPALFDPPSPTFIVTMNGVKETDIKKSRLSDFSKPIQRKPATVPNQSDFGEDIGGAKLLTSPDRAKARAARNLNEEALLQDRLQQSQTSYHGYLRGIPPQQVAKQSNLLSATAISNAQLAAATLLMQQTPAYSGPPSLTAVMSTQQAASAVQSGAQPPSATNSGPGGAIYMQIGDPLAATKMYKEKCRYWPSCRSVSLCPYLHPTVACSNTSKCRFGGDACLFMHPPCRFAASCTKKSTCAFSHPPGGPASSALTGGKPSKFVKPKPHGLIKAEQGPEVTQVSLTSRDPPPIPTSLDNPRLNSGATSFKTSKNGPSSEIMCKFMPYCANKRCQFKHIKKCSFGAKCYAKATCVFWHPPDTVAQGEQLKWTNPKMILGVD